jgi:putative DNA methylase
MRMIERWFPCQEVSEASAAGWGTGNAEASIFTWFAKRPLAQAKAAVITSLLPWPDDPAEQLRLQDLVRRSLVGSGDAKKASYDEAHDDLVAELARHYPLGARLLDPFSGRAMIPLEAARLGVAALGVDYSPLATLAGQLLAEYPLRGWDEEPPLPFGEDSGRMLRSPLADDVASVLVEVGRRYEKAMAKYYPAVVGLQPWGYLWAISLPCRECGRRFPLTGPLQLRHPLPRKNDPGQSYDVLVDKGRGSWDIDVHEGAPYGQPTRVVAQGKNKYDSDGKVAVCPFCGHVHPKEVHTRLAREGLGQDELVVVADTESSGRKVFRAPTDIDLKAIGYAEKALLDEPGFGTLPAVPDEQIPPGNTWTIQPTVYGAKTYGDLANQRQTLGFVRLCRTINELAADLASAGLSSDYITALTGYAASVLARKLRRATRGCTLQPRLDKRSDSSYVNVSDVFGANESSIGFSYDYFEVGLGEGAGSWATVADDTVNALRRQAKRPAGRPADLQRGSATAIPRRPESLDAVVTDPPYDSMIDYSDASDLFYVWVKRALSSTHPELLVTAEPHGLQDKDEEIIVKKGTPAGDHRTQEHYDRLMAKALSEAARVVRSDGVVTIVFGHGDPDVWRRLLDAITSGGLYLTGSWPARTEKGGQAGSSNIQTTLTMCCRPIVPGRPLGRVNEVRMEIRKVIKERVPLWETSRLALTDQLMASAGPAMEVVGRYSEVVDPSGEPVEPYEFLVLARRAVQEAAAIRIDNLPLETFDARTQFGLFWSRLFGRGVAPKSEARWQAMASDLSMDDLRGVLTHVDKGTRLCFGTEAKRLINPESAVIDVALALSRAWQEGLDEVGRVIAASGRDADDNHLFAALTYLSARMPESDPDRAAWTAIVRYRSNLGPAVKNLAATARKAESDAGRLTLFDLRGEDAE